MAFWGDAQWSRTQLLGELARGNWGMCRASVSDLVTPVAERRAALECRLLVAPETEMTDDFIRAAQRTMQQASPVPPRHAPPRPAPPRPAPARNPAAVQL